MLRTTARILVALACLTVWAAPPASGEALPRPPALEAEVRFWQRIFSEVGVDSGLLHDSRHLDVVYDEISVPKDLSRRARGQRVREARREYEAALRRLATGRRSNLSATERHVLALWPPGVTNATLRAAARRVRFQRGLADKFREGLIRSGLWEPHIRDVFQRSGIPPDVAALPHVESSFYPGAYSRVGAAGLWQFTRSTGRHYLRIDHVVDERLDPFKATEAAARLLLDNQAALQSWPLAITAYNHGRGGMLRAVRQLGTRDIATIVERYRSRTFGFASRNFYAELLAAVDVEGRAEELFGPLRKLDPADYQVVELDHFYRVSSLEQVLGLDASVLRKHNPALREPVWQGEKYVPRGFVLRVPRSLGGASSTRALAAIPARERFVAQRPDTVYTVRRGDTLSTIARRFGVRQSELVALNGLRSRHYLRIGQRLRLPGGEAGSAASVADLADFDGRYRVRRGDTLSAIARRFGVDQAELAAANDLRNRHRLQVGQELVVPVGANEAVQVAEGPGAAAAGGEDSTRRQAESPAKPVQVASADPAVEPTPEPAPEPAPASAAAPTREAPPAAAEAPEPGVAPEGGVAPSSPSAPPAQSPTPSRPEAPPAAASPAPAETESTAALARVDSSPGAAEPVSHPPPARLPAVSADGYTEVEPGETLGHYADWLEIPTAHLRRLNGMRGRSNIAMGQQVRLDFSRVSAEAFETRRRAYHRSLRQTFFADYRVAGTRVHVLRRGETLWSLSRSHRQVPLWLLRHYNPHVDLSALHPGERLRIPQVEPRPGRDFGATPDDAPGTRLVSGPERASRPVV